MPKKQQADPTFDKTRRRLPTHDHPSSNIYTMKDFQSVYEGADYINAIAIWDSIAEANYRYIVLESEGRYTSALPPIVSSFMPKAGGTFLFNRMIKPLGYLEFYWGVTRMESHTEVYPTMNALSVYQRGGFFCHSHALPTPYFRMIMEREEIGPIWVHIRHPGEVCLAGYFHYQGEGQGQGEAKAKRLAAMAVQLEYLRSAHGFALGDWPTFFRQWIGFYSQWLLSWLTYAEDRPGSVVFTYFDELQDVPALLGRVFAAHGRTLPIDAIATDLPEDRRRSEGNHDWREGLSEDDIASQADHLAVWDRVVVLRQG